MKKRWKFLAGFVLVAAVIAVGLQHFRVAEERSNTAAPATAVPVGVGALGRVEPASRVRSLSLPGGTSSNRLEVLFVKEGDKVTKGQLLAEFADVVLKDLAIQQAQAALAEAEATLSLTRAAGRPSEVAAQRARIEALGVDLEYAKRDAQRDAQLLPSGAGTKVAADESLTNVARLSAARKQAEAELETLISPRPENIAISEARVSAAKVALRKAQAESDLSRLKAPMDGTVLHIFIWPGEQVSDQGILELGDLSKLDVVAEVYESDVPRLRIGSEAEIIVPGEGLRFKATVYEIGRTVRRGIQASTDPIAAVDSRTIEVRLALDADGIAALGNRSNMQVQVAIQP